MVRLVTENRDWGYRRILGALSNLGHAIGRGTVANILKQQGIEPAPERSRKTTWKEFLRRHWDVLVAADFLTVEVWTRSGLTRFMVLFSDRPFDAARGDRRHRHQGRWNLDGSGRRNLCDDGDGFLDREEISHSRRNRNRICGRLASL